MHMAVDEPRHDRLATEVEDLRVRAALRLQHLRGPARAHDARALHRHGFDNRELCIDRQDLAVVQNQVRIGGSK